MYTRQMRMGLIYSFRKSSWQSCQSIVQNLRSCYLKAIPEEKITEFNYHTDISRYEILKIAKNIHQKKINQLIFIDHRPHIQTLLECLDQLGFFNESSVSVVIHVYGDFPLYSYNWNECQAILKKAKIHFVCASEKQAHFIKNLQIDNKNTHVIPFPVDHNFFSYLELDRVEVRNKSCLGDQITFLYSGRLSNQKKILELIKYFSLFSSMFNKKTKLILAGSFDGLGVPYLGQVSERERYELDCMKMIDKFNSTHTESEILYLSNLNQEDLRKAYLLADAYVSFSLHNDEDFGMAPAEALVMGLPLILTNWAGYSSFKNYGESVELVDVSLEEGYLKIDAAQAVSALLKVADEIENHRKNRMKYVERALTSLSFKSVEEKIQKILKLEARNFKGFNQKLKMIITAFQYRNHAPFREEVLSPKYNSTYKEIYEHYFQQKN